MSPSASTAIREFRLRSKSRAPYRSRRVIPVSKIFPTKTLNFRAGPDEVVVLGGREKFPLVAEAFDNAGIKQISFIGWGSQGPAQAQNLRDTLAHINRPDIKVCVGLREGSKSIPAVEQAGFNKESGTLGDYLELAKTSDLIICLVADGGMVEIYKDVFAAAKPGAIIGISHGFIVGYMQSIAESLPKDHDLIMVAPKGMGPSVRALYVQSLETEGAGINSSVAIHVNDPARLALVTDVANAWSIGIGSPVTFGTDFMSEVTSDLFGERAILLGALWGITEALYSYFLVQGCGPELAFAYGVSGITGTVTELISEKGILGFRDTLTELQLSAFERGYAIGYPVCDEIHGQIYDNVACLQEIKDVIVATKRLKTQPMQSVESDPMWQEARKKGWYGRSVQMCDELAFSAGVYIGAMVSQLHLLVHHGHNISEVLNESEIEATDSLTPFMHSRGVATMVHNCSTTAQLGALRYGPLYKRALNKVLQNTALELDGAERAAVLATLGDGDLLIHDTEICFELRPSVKISVPAVA